MLRVFIIGRLQDVQQLTHHAGVPRLSRLYGHLGQMVAQHIFGVGSQHVGTGTIQVGVLQALLIALQPCLQSSAIHRQVQHGLKRPILFLTPVPMQGVVTALIGHPLQDLLDEFAIVWRRRKSTQFGSHAVQPSPLKAIGVRVQD